MKKYLSLFAIFALIVFLGAKIVRADDRGQTQSEDNTKIETPDNGESDDQSVTNSEEDNSELQNNDEQNQADEESKRVETEKETEIIRTNAKVKMEGLKTAAKNEPNTAKAKVETEIITSRQNALDRFDGTVAKVSDLLDKLTTLTDTLATKGVDVTEAKTYLLTASVALTDAESKIATANTIFSSSINQLSADQKTSLKALTIDIQTLIDGARDALKQAVKSLKDSVANKK